MSEPISKILSSANPKDSITAIVDRHGIPMGVEVEINGVGISLPVEQFSSKDATMDHPRAVWVDGPTRREIFVDHVRKTSYVRSIQDNAPVAESTQTVKTVVVVVHMESGAKAAGGIIAKPQDKPGKEPSPSPAETIIKGGVKIAEPKPEEPAARADAVHAWPGPQIPAADNLFRGGIFCLGKDDKACGTPAPSSPPKGDAPPTHTDGESVHQVPEPAGIQESHAEDHLSNSLPLLSGATDVWVGARIWVGDRKGHGVEPRPIPVNSNTEPVSRSPGMTDAGTKIPSPQNDNFGRRVNHPFMERADHALHPQSTRHSPPLDKVPVVCGDEIHNPVGAPIAPPPVAVSTVLAAPRLHSTKDGLLVESPSPSPDSDGEGRDQQEKRDGQQDPQDEHPSSPEEQSS